MKKIIILFLILVLIWFCTRRAEKVERIMENGVEIVINHIEPYKLKNEPSSFTLEKEFEIDLEREDIAKIGLTEIYDFDVDSKGNIYILDFHNPEKLIFKFDAEGNYLKSFCRIGQGPGELPKSFKMWIGVIKDDEIYVFSKNKFLFIKTDGTLIKEVKTPFNPLDAKCLSNGNYILEKLEWEGKAYSTFIYSLYDSQFNKINELDRIKVPTGFAQRVKGIYHNIIAEVNAGKIFTGSQGRDYEIYVYDFDGNLIRKIRKEYKKVSPSIEYKDKFLSMFKGSPRVYEAAKKRIYFPSHLPPFHYFLSDNKGRLYVMTYEKGDNEGEYMFDIFNPEGIFIGRKSLKDFSATDHLKGKIKNDYFYCIEEKESGFQKLVVYKMLWH